MMKRLFCVFLTIFVWASALAQGDNVVDFSRMKAIGKGPLDTERAAAMCLGIRSPVRATRADITVVYVTKAQWFDPVSANSLPPNSRIPRDAGETYPIRLESVTVIDGTRATGQYAKVMPVRQIPNNREGYVFFNKAFKEYYCWSRPQGS